MISRFFQPLSYNSAALHLYRVTPDIILGINVDRFIPFAAVYCTSLVEA